MKLKGKAYFKLIDFFINKCYLLFINMLVLSVKKTQIYEWFIIYLSLLLIKWLKSYMSTHVIYIKSFVNNKFRTKLDPI